MMKYPTNDTPVAVIVPGKPVAGDLVESVQPGPLRGLHRGPAGRPVLLADDLPERHDMRRRVLRRAWRAGPVIDLAYYRLWKATE